MGKVSDIVFMVLGVLLLVLTLTGEIELGAIGIIAALACIGFGLVTMYKMRLAGSAMKSPLLQDERVARFYQTTLQAWAAGQLAVLNKNFAKEGRLDYRQFVKKYPPVEGGALHTFFSRFPPLGGEYLVGVGDSDSVGEKGWFVLTNLRLIQKDGRDKTYREVPLSQVASFEMTGTWTKRLLFAMKTGKTIDFEKVDIYPSESFVSQLTAGAEDSPQPSQAQEATPGA